MDLLRIIRSIEELIYELTSWLLFYPLTLWHSLRHPLEMMSYVAAEEQEREEARFTDALSPPLLLFVTILLAHAIELGTFGVVRNAGGTIARLLASSEQLLLLFRALVFSLFPLIGAAVIVRVGGGTFSRAALRTPFFALCCIAAPFALVVSLGLILSRAGTDLTQAGGLALIAAAALYYFVLQAAWMRQVLRIGRLRAALLSTAAGGAALAYLLIVLAAIAGAQR